jgi:uncharacterized protein
MSLRRAIPRLAACAVIPVLLAGCASGAAKTTFYTLSAEAAGGAAAPPAPATQPPPALSVAVWQVAIPELVDRRQIVVRTARNRVDISDLHQWAEPLRLGIARALAADLAAQLGAGYTVAAGQPLGTAPAVRIFVDVQRFDAVAGGTVAVEALWSVRPAQGERRDGRAVAEEPAPADPGGIAAAYSRALARIARDMAPAVAALRSN